MANIYKFYDKNFVPKNLEELYCSGWKEYMLYHIRKYSLQDINNSPEDLLQDMMVQLANTHYIESYDPKLCDEFTGYLYTFIKNFMSKPYNREHHTKYGNTILNAASIVNDPVEAAEENKHEISASMIAGKEVDFTDSVCLLDALEKDLKKIKTDSWVDYNGKRINRSPFTVYNMLKDGYNVREIANIFGTSKQYVYTLRDRIKSIMTMYA